MNRVLADLAAIDACRDAREWGSKFSDPQAAWDKCPHPSWMLWLLGQVSGPVGDPKRVALTALCTAVAQLEEDAGKRQRCLDNAALITHSADSVSAHAAASFGSSQRTVACRAIRAQYPNVPTVGGDC